MDCPAEEELERSAPGVRSAPDRRARGAQPTNANARKHGLYSLARRLKGAGVTRTDGRSALERLKNDWKADVRAARGNALSPQQEALLEVAANTWLMLSTADDFILERGAINRRKSSVRPIVEQRSKLARTLRELLSDIGLERATKPRPVLADHVRRHYGKTRDERASAADGEGPADA